MNPAYSMDDFSRIIVTERQISTKLDELAEQVRADYEGKDLLLVGVLKGAVMVMADLARRLPPHVQMDWMAVSSYGSGTKSSGVVRILKDLDAQIGAFADRTRLVDRTGQEPLEIVSGPTPGTTSRHPLWLAVVAASVGIAAGSLSLLMRMALAGPARLHDPHD